MDESDKFEDSQIKVSYSKGSESVEVLNLEALDPKYVVEKYTHTADKKALKDRHSIILSVYHPMSFRSLCVNCRSLYFGAIPASP